MPNPTYKVGYRMVELSHTTGVVIKANKRTESNVSGSVSSSYDPISGGNKVSGSVSTQHTVYDDVFVRSDDGKENTIRLTNFDLACREGHRMSFVYMSPAGLNDKYRIVMVKNHDTGTLNSPKSCLVTALRPRHRWGWAVSGLVGAACVPVVSVFAVIPFVMAAAGAEVSFRIIGAKRRRAFLKTFDVDGYLNSLGRGPGVSIAPGTPAVTAT